MEISDTKIAIGAIVILETGLILSSYLIGGTTDSGTLGMGIAAIAGLAGYDMGKKAA
jgi:hypothetical protein